jgi:hypothetical protein
VWLDFTEGIGIETVLQPLFPPKLNWMLCALGSIAATHRISRAKLLAAPADAFRMTRPQGYFATHQ